MQKSKAVYEPKKGDNTMKPSGYTISVYTAWDNLVTDGKEHDKDNIVIHVQAKAVQTLQLSTLIGQLVQTKIVIRLNSRVLVLRPTVKFGWQEPFVEPVKTTVAIYRPSCPWA